MKMVIRKRSNAETMEKIIAFILSLYAKKQPQIDVAANMVQNNAKWRR